MEYIKDNYKVKIERTAFYTQLKVYDIRNNQLIFEKPFLPLCQNRIEAENNAERIVNITIFSK